MDDHLPEVASTARIMNSRFQPFRTFGLLLAVVVALGPIAAAQQDDSLAELVIGLLQEQDTQLRALGLEQVRREVKGEEATRRFAAQLPKLAPEAQVGLLSALADRGDKAARPAVLDLVASEQPPEVQAAAIGALGSLGQPDDIPLLMRFLAEGGQGVQGVQDAARSSLVRLQGDGVSQAMISATSGTSTELQVAIIQILESRRALETIPELLAMASGRHAPVRQAAMAALAQLAGPEHLAGMVQGLLKAERGREREAAERAIAQVAARIGDPSQQASPLLAAMERLPAADRLVALPALGRVGGPEALAVIEAELASRSAPRHDAAVRSLCKWPDASVAGQLIKLARSDAHSAHRNMAIGALIRVAPLPDGRPDEQRLDLVRQVMGMCRTEDQRMVLLQRAAAVRTVETLRYVLPYLQQPRYAQQACQTIVELAHHRGLREPNKDEFHSALDKVIEVSKDPVVVERARRYQNDQTWVRPSSDAAGR
jgi:HEAT repeat protein